MQVFNAAIPKRSNSKIYFGDWLFSFVLWPYCHLSRVELITLIRSSMGLMQWILKEWIRPKSILIDTHRICWSWKALCFLILICCYFTKEMLSICRRNIRNTILKTLELLWELTLSQRRQCGQKIYSLSIWVLLFRPKPKIGFRSRYIEINLKYIFEQKL